MKLSLDLKYDTTKEWVETVMNDFNSFLQDHADCERKASSMAMSFVAKCPDKTEIIPELIETAVEELEHFQQVYSIMEKRGVQLKTEMSEDLYVKQLLALMRSDSVNRSVPRHSIMDASKNLSSKRFTESLRIKASNCFTYKSSDISVFNCTPRFSIMEYTC